LAKIEATFLPISLFLIPGFSDKIDAQFFPKHQTDRQMDTQRKSTWWSITAYNNEIELCEGTLPEWVKSIHGGRETCPTTGRLHFQGAVQCFQQQRMSKFKTWLPTAHLEPARQEDALKKYVMKKETSAGEKTVRENQQIFYKAHDLLRLLARQDRRTDTGYYARVRMVLREQPTLAGQLMNPSLRKFWDETALVWIEAEESTPGGYSITPPGNECNGCGKDECIACYEREQNNTIEYNHGMEQTQVVEEQESGEEALSEQE